MKVNEECVNQIAGNVCLWGRERPPITGTFSFLDVCDDSILVLKCTQEKRREEH